MSTLLLPQGPQRTDEECGVVSPCTVLPSTLLFLHLWGLAGQLRASW